MFAAKNQLLTRKAAVAAAIVFDAAGQGANSSAGVLTASTTWLHTATGPVVAFAHLSTQGTSAPTSVSCTYGGTTMTLLGSVAYQPSANPSGRIYAYGLLSPAAGSQTVSFTFTVPVGQGIITVSGQSVSYKNVTTFGTPVTSSGNSTSRALTVASATSHMATVAIGDLGGISQSAFNQTPRWNNPGSTYAATIVGDAAGAASVSFSATGSSIQWGCIGLDMH